MTVGQRYALNEFALRLTWVVLGAALVVITPHWLGPAALGGFLVFWTIEAVRTARRFDGELEQQKRDQLQAMHALSDALERMDASAIARALEYRFVQREIAELVEEMRARLQ